jgi:hypothetical protein
MWSKEKVKSIKGKFCLRGLNLSDFRRVSPSPSPSPSYYVTSLFYSIQRFPPISEKQAEKRRWSNFLNAFHYELRLRGRFFSCLNFFCSEYLAWKEKEPRTGLVSSFSPSFPLSLNPLFLFNFSFLLFPFDALRKWGTSHSIGIPYTIRNLRCYLYTL